MSFAVHILKSIPFTDAINKNLREAKEKRGVKDK